MNTQRDGNLDQGYELVQSTQDPAVLLLRVNADVLQCNVRKLHYATYLGHVNTTTWKITIWMPAASIPRGYRKAAKLALERAAAACRKEREEHV